METRFKDDEQWAALATYLPPEVDLWSRETGALVREREIKDGETLLRLALVHASGLSLRDTAQWADEQGIASISDVALLKRFRRLSETLQRVVQSLLPAPAVGPRLYLMDASYLCRPVARGTDYLLHMGWDAGGMKIHQVRITGPKPRESFKTLPLEAGCVYVGDRGYGYRPGVGAVHEAQALVLVRVSLNSLPIRTKDGPQINLLEVSRPLRVGETLDLDVETIPMKKGGIPSIPGRLVVLRKSPEQAEKERKTRQAEAKKKGQKLKASTGESAQYLFLFTTLSREEADPSAILSTYRHRWQIEMLFKRLKSITGLDCIKARDPALASVVILAKLVAILLIQAIQGDFSPWGYALPRRIQPVAGAQ